MTMEPTMRNPDAAPNVYRVRFFAFPTCKHRFFADWDTATVGIWLMDSNPESAKRRASAIMDQLHYEYNSDRVRVDTESEALQFDNPDNSLCLKSVKRLGIAFQILPQELGGGTPADFFGARQS